MVMMAAFCEGQLLEGKYRLEREMGRGGMGVVVRAHHLELDEPVAIKLLLPDSRGDPHLVTRFQREARAAAKLKGEHVVRVLDVGSSAGHGPFMVMEHLTGETLATRLASGGPLPVTEAVAFVLQACVAMAEAHARGIVHRDLKPSNLFLTCRPDGSPLVKVLDFGISKIAQPTHNGELTVTTTSAVLGSCAYMSPEQARNARHVDARTDVWSLGVILHRLVSGRAPFEAQSASEFIAKIAADPPVPLREHAPDAPAELEAVVLRCLQKDRAARYGDVAELARALAPLSPASEALVDRVVATARAVEARCSEPELELPAGSAPTLVGEAPAEASASTATPGHPFAAAVRVGDAGSTSAVVSDRRGPRRRRLVGIAAGGAIGALVVAGLFVVRRANAPAGSAARAPEEVRAAAPSTRLADSPTRPPPVEATAGAVCGAAAAALAGDCPRAMSLIESCPAKLRHEADAVITFKCGGPIVGAGGERKAPDAAPPPVARSAAPPRPHAPRRPKPATPAPKGDPLSEW
jgi:serine/threonine-protein kinase